MEKFDLEKGKWEKVAEVQGNKCKVPKLQEGHQYKFRVIAENKNGDSEPLETESPVTAKNPYGECILTLVVFFYLILLLTRYFSLNTALHAASADMTSCGSLSALK